MHTIHQDLPTKIPVSRAYGWSLIHPYPDLDPEPEPDLWIKAVLDSLLPCLRGFFSEYHLPG